MMPPHLRMWSWSWKEIEMGTLTHIPYTTVAFELWLLETRKKEEMHRNPRHSRTVQHLLDTLEEKKHQRYISTSDPLIIDINTILQSQLLLSTTTKKGARVHPFPYGCSVE